MKRIHIMKGKHILSVVTALSIIITTMGIMLTGCGMYGADGDAKSSKDGNFEPVTFEDSLGRTVTVNSCNRVAAMIGSFADVWITAGGSLVAAANDSWESFELNLTEDVINIGSILSPNTEMLLAAAPDFVIASSNTESNVRLKDTLENAGITVAYFDVSNFEDYLKMLDICTDLTGRKDLYKTNGLDVRDKIEEIKKRVDKSNPRILFLRASSTSVKAKSGEGTVGGEMLKDLGCINIADTNSSLDDLSIEAVVKANPDYIFVTTQGTDTQAAINNLEKKLTGSPVWSSLTAVKEGRFYILDKKLYNLKPNARWAEAYEQLADILYPVK
ncbi:MAG: ABC transporter substrate-binding protein [Lachnospira sp.]